MAEVADAPTGWLVGAYAAAPSRSGWDGGREGAFLDAIAALHGVVGLELPWKAGAFHAHDERWMLDRLPDDAQIVVTTAPDTSARHRASASFGLASNDRQGRRDAVEAVRDLHAALPRLRAAVPAGRIVAVELHAAPRAAPGASSAASLSASLDEVAGWDWGGAQVVVEHCDAWTASRAPAKGFLPIEAEIDVTGELRRQGAPVGLAINWGRSVIERRDADAGRAHVALAASAGVLDGLIFSGAATGTTPLGAAWADVHAPFATPGAYETSLLTPQLADATLRTAGSLRFQAVKVAAPATASVDDRIAVVAHALGGVRSRANAA